MSAFCVMCGEDVAPDHECPARERFNARRADDFDLPSTGAGHPPTPAPVARRSPSEDAPAQGQSRATRRRDNARQQAEGAGVVSLAAPAPVEPVVELDVGEESRGAGIRQAQPDTLDELAEAWHHFGREIEHGTWGRVAVVAKVRRNYGEATIDTFAEKVGVHRSTLYRLLKVHDTFAGELSRRRDNVTFWHYVEALRAPEPEKALEAAETEGLSVRGLRERIDAEKPAKKPRALAPPSEPKPAAEVVDVAREPAPEAEQHRQPSRKADLVDAAEAEGNLRELARLAFEPARKVFTDDWPEGEPVTLLIKECKALLRDLEAYQAAHS